MAFADFGPVPGSEVEARNGQERVECGLERPIRVAGAVRRRLQESAQVRGNRRDQAKKSQPIRVGIFGIGGGRLTMCRPASRAYEYRSGLLLTDRLIMLKTARALLIPT